MFDYAHIKQEYEFRINGHSLTSLVVFHKKPYALVGFDDGIVRKISLTDYKALGEV